MTAMTYKRALKDNVRTVLNWYDLIKGLYTFNKTGQTPDKAYQAMIRLHGVTSGGSTDWLANQFSTLNQEQAIMPQASGILGNLTKEDLIRVNHQLKENGYYVFDQVVPTAICDQITEFALTIPALVETEDLKGYRKEHVVFDPMRPISKTYKVPESVLITHPIVQELMADVSIRSIVKAYVRTEPVLTSVNTWFSPVYQPQFEGEASAQTYHFDMVNPRWLKFFIYLSDVDHSNGPHCFIKKSHTKNKKAKHLLKRGYVRIPDEDVFATYGQENEIAFTAKKGTLIVEDTRGFHKGKIPLQGYRSIFEMTYAVNLFGGSYTKYKLPKAISAKLQEMMQQHPISYQRYEIET
jgi:hypothetical protein